MSAKKVTETEKKATPAKAAESVSPKTTVAAKAPVKEVEEKAAAPAKEAAVKEEKAPAKKTAAPKKTAPKAAAKTTKTAKTAKEAVSQNVYIQFAGKEVKTGELVEQVKAQWTAEGHRVSSIKSLEVYVKPEDNAAYYVVNGKENGKVDL